MKCLYYRCITYIYLPLFNDSTITKSLTSLQQTLLLQNHLCQQQQKDAGNNNAKFQFGESCEQHSKFFYFEYQLIYHVKSRFTIYGIKNFDRQIKKLTSFASAIASATGSNLHPRLRSPKAALRPLQVQTLSLTCAIAWRYMQCQREAQPDTE